MGCGGVHSGHFNRCGFFVQVDIYSVFQWLLVPNLSGWILGVWVGGDLRTDECILKDDNGKM